MNDDGLTPGARVSVEDYERISALHRLAKQMVARGDQPDLATALAAVRG